MIARKYTRGDYEMVCEWWAGHGWPALPEAGLPETGLIVYENGQPFCAGFLYKSDSNIAWVEWVVSRPEANPRSVVPCISVLVKELVLMAAEAGYATVFTSIKNEALMRLYKRCGFVVSDDGMTNMLNIIGG